MTDKWPLALVIFLVGFRPVYTKHDTFDKVDTELNQMENALQDKAFTVNNTTPNVTDLQDHEFQIVATTGQPAAINLVLRIGTTMYISPNWKLIQGR